MKTTPFNLADNRLTTGKESPLLPQLVAAINQASEIEIAVSFLQVSGLELLFLPLQEALERGANLKLLTSDYLGITNPVALRQLLALEQSLSHSNQQIDLRIYKTSRAESFHLKSYIFTKIENQHIIEGCAFIGSNNISKTALTSGHEWSLRHDFTLANHNEVAAKQFQQIRAAFCQLFLHHKVETLTHYWIDDYINRRQKLPLTLLSSQDTVEIVPNSAQERALIALSQTRLAGYKRGLVVLATGMGKTWLSAFDAQQMTAKCILFVAHREEILIQAQKTFSLLMPEKASGFYNGQSQTSKSDIVFASIQTLGKYSHLQKFAINHFDYIIVDEFHHANAKTYRNLLNYFQPQFLLGLTATPHRSDQADILSLCDNNLVFERDLIEGINDNLLVPFHYYGIWDKYVEYESIPWRNGKFDPNELDNRFASDKRATHIFKLWQQHKQTRTLAFCVSIKHAEFMSAFFNGKGVRACAVHSKSLLRRNEALQQLNSGQLDIIFSVDLFNEGTDLPSIDCVLMIRPTESKIIFLQQLGRGLRLHHDKKHLVVLDFIGNHKSFLQKPQTFFGGSSIRTIVQKINASKALANGCFVNYDLDVINFWQQLAKVSPISIQDEFLEQTRILKRRPTATEFFQNGFEMKRLNTRPNSWFEVVAAHSSEVKLQQVVSQYCLFLLEGVQKTNMTKCFKAILLEAFLGLDGLHQPPTIKKLAIKSWQVLNRYPQLKQHDLPKQEQCLKATDKAWLTYWRKNPVNAFTKAKYPWFIIENDRFKANFEVSHSDKDMLHDLVQELVDLRLAQYIERINNLEKSQPIKQINSEEKQLLPFYPSLPIACGHFKTGLHDEVEMREVSLQYGRFDAKRHFLALASGHSMNGGKNPIHDGDCLILEKITPTNAGSLNGQIIVLEQQEGSGSDQYLLRKVYKDKSQYLLVANNPNYKTIIADEGIKPLARLKAIITN